MSYGQYELTSQDLELAQSHAPFVLTGIQIARVLRYDYLPRHSSHVHPVAARALRKIYQERKQHEPFGGDELNILSHPSLVVNTADKSEDAAFELGILLELQEIATDVDISKSHPVGNDHIHNYKETT